tara:strand:- start:7134 stop:7304 length:171 start_codon:yes stop_codon:yes gene_type:complete
MQTGYVVESFTVQTLMEHREQNQDASAQKIALQHTMIGVNMVLATIMVAPHELELP